MELATTIQQVYESEINFKVSCFWDGGFDVEIGDEMNGWKGHKNVDAADEIPAVLAELAVAAYPDSDFAKEFLKEQTHENR